MTSMKLHQPLPTNAAVTTVKLSGGAAPPSVADLASAVTSLESAGRDLQAALSAFRRVAADAMSHNDLLAGETELPSWLQQKLFAIAAIWRA
jgi:hypothetical protein